MGGYEICDYERKLLDLQYEREREREGEKFKVGLDWGGREGE